MEVKAYAWNEEKNEKLKAKRGISFEEVVSSELLAAIGDVIQSYINEINTEHIQAVGGISFSQEYRTDDLKIVTYKDGDRISSVEIDLHRSDPEIKVSLEGVPKDASLHLFPFELGVTDEITFTRGKTSIEQLSQLALSPIFLP